MKFDIAGKRGSLPIPAGRQPGGAQPMRGVTRCRAPPQGRQQAVYTQNVRRMQQ